MYCICCKKDIVKPMEVSKSDPSLLTGQTEEDILWGEFETDYNTTRNIDNEMIDGGIIQIITAGWVSNHDSDRFIIAICDNCIQENLDDGTLLLFQSGNYISPEEDLQKSKKIYRRRKRLDNLTSEL